MCFRGIYFAFVSIIFFLLDVGTEFLFFILMKMIYFLGAAVATIVW